MRSGLARGTGDGNISSLWPVEVELQFGPTHLVWVLWLEVELS